MSPWMFTLKIWWRDSGGDSNDECQEENKEDSETEVELSSDDDNPELKKSRVNVQGFRVEKESLRKRVEELDVVEVEDIPPPPRNRGKPKPKPKRGVKTVTKGYKKHHQESFYVPAPAETRPKHESDYHHDSDGMDQTDSIFVVFILSKTFSKKKPSTFPKIPSEISICSGLKVKFYKREKPKSVLMAGGEDDKKVKQKEVKSIVGQQRNKEIENDNQG
ncbi:hypothetical protein COLO4_20740 [Corchorus olitorius]|uniref:Uncharacterized protein n=1 Tax=Corchorus olitorius TaxID=93759 RepID=A0A1R3IXD0_9ROSI|nr:hypothetical protein COLO4_20740 [Corchorus olitorius]